MTTAVVTLSPEADLHEAVRVLSEHKISGVPVIDAHNYVLGVVSDADLLALAGMPREHTFRDLVQHLLGRPSPMRKTGTTVAEIMMAPAITVRGPRRQPGRRRSYYPHGGSSGCPSSRENSA
jgi:CBS domain-containing protein